MTKDIKKKDSPILIIPAIDMIDGKCVRLSQGDYKQKKVYDNDPLDVAKKYEDNGITRLHLVDLDGAEQKHIVNWRVLEKIAGHTKLIIDFGGGLKSDEDLKVAFESGASMITGGSIAVKDRDTFLRWLRVYGSGKIILGADAKDGKIAVSGWRETSELTLIKFIESYVKHGINKVISTDISRDGMMTGANTELYKEIQEHFPDLEVIASGGISCMDDVLKLNDMGVQDVIVGKAIYEKRISMEDISNFYKNY